MNLTNMLLRLVTGIEKYVLSKSYSFGGNFFIISIAEKHISSWNTMRNLVLFQVKMFKQ